MAENLGILINTGFNLDINKLQSELSSLQQKTKLNLDIQFDTKQLDSFKKQMQSSVNSTKINTQEFTQAQKNAEAFYNSVIEKTNRYKIGLMDLDEYIKKVQSQLYKNNGEYAPQFMNLDSSKQIKIINDLNNALKEQQRIANETYKINTSIQKEKELEVQKQINEEIKQKNILEGQSKNYWQGRFNESIKDMTAIDSELVKMKQFYQEQEKVASTTEKRIQKEKQVNQQLEVELANYKKYAKLQTENIGNRYKNVNGVSENLSAYNKELSEIIVKNGKLVNSNTGVETSFKNLRQGLSNIRVEARNSQNVFTDFKDNIEKFSNWLLVGGFTTGLITGIKEAITEINSLSDAITDLRRVSEASDSQLSVLDDQAFKIADKIGGSAEGIVNSMANFSQLGYEYDKAMNLAQDASKYATAGFISNEEATQSLISTYQVFGNTFDEVMGKMVDSKSIIDAFNSVGKFIA